MEVRHVTPLIVAATRTDPNPRRGPDAVAAKRISIAYSGGTVTKCHRPSPSLHNQIGAMIVIMLTG